MDNLLKIGSDISDNYILLGEIYSKNKEDDKLDLLKSKVAESQLVMKERILCALNFEK